MKLRYAVKPVVLAGAVCFLALCFLVRCSKPGGSPAHTYMTNQAAALNAVKQNPDDLIAHQALASTYWHNRDFANAVKSQREVVRLDPNDRMQKLTLGVYLRRAGQNDEGIKIYKELAQENDAAGQRAKKILSKTQQTPAP